jgi:hypothetical protein
MNQNSNENWHHKLNTLHPFQRNSFPSCFVLFLSFITIYTPKKEKTASFWNSLLAFHKVNKKSYTKNFNFNNKKSYETSTSVFLPNYQFNFFQFFWLNYSTISYVNYKSFVAFCILRVKKIKTHLKVGLVLWEEGKNRKDSSQS